MIHFKHGLHNIKEETMKKKKGRKSVTRLTDWDREVISRYSGLEKALSIALKSSSELQEDK